MASIVARQPGGAAPSAEGGQLASLVRRLDVVIARLTPVGETRSRSASNVTTVPAPDSVHPAHAANPKAVADHAVAALDFADVSFSRPMQDAGAVRPAPASRTERHESPRMPRTTPAGPPLFRPAGDLFPVAPSRGASPVKGDPLHSGESRNRAGSVASHPAALSGGPPLHLHTSGVLDGAGEVTIPLSVPVPGLRDPVPIQLHFHVEGFGHASAGEEGAGTSALAQPSPAVELGTSSASRLDYADLRATALHTDRLPPPTPRASGERQRDDEGDDRHASKSGGRRADSSSGHHRGSGSEQESAEAAASVAHLAKAVVRTDVTFAARERTLRLRTVWSAWRRVVETDRPGQTQFASSPSAAWTALRLTQLCWSSDRVLKQPIWSQRERAIHDRSRAHLPALDRLHLGLSAAPRRPSTADAVEGSLVRTADTGLAAAAFLSGERSSSSFPRAPFLPPDGSPTRPSGGRLRKSSVAELREADTALERVQGEGSALHATQRGRSHSAVRAGDRSLDGSTARALPQPTSTQQAWDASTAQPPRPVGGRPPGGPEVVRRSETSLEMDLEWEAARTAIATAAAFGFALPLHRPTLLCRVQDTAQPCHLMMCFHAWRGWVRAKQRIQSRSELRICAATFRPWAAMAAASLQLRRKGHIVEAQAARRQARAVLRAWWECTATRRSASLLSTQLNGLTCLFRSMEQRGTRDALQSWREQSRRVRCLRKAVLAVRSLELSRAFRGFAQAVAWARATRANLALAADAFQRLVIVRALHKWRGAAAQCKGSVTVLATAVHRLQHVHLYRCLTRWRTSTAKTLGVRAALAPILARLRQTALGRAFNTLRAYREARKDWRQYRQAQVAALTSARTRRAVCTWHDDACSNARHKVALRRAVQAWTHRSLGSAFRAWGAHVAEKQALLRVATSAARALTNGKLHSAVTSWRATSAARRAAKAVLAKAVARLRSRHEGAAFNAWKAYVAEKRRLQTLALHAASAVSGGKLRAALLRWRENCVTRQHVRVSLRSALSFWTNATLRRTFRSLSVHAASRQAWRERAHAGIAAAQAGRVRKALTTWCKWARRHRVVQRMLLVSSAARREAGLATCFQAWRGYTKRCGVVRAAAATVTAAHATREQRSAVTAWKSWAQQSAAIRGATEAHAAAWRARHLRGAVRGWRKAAGVPRIMQRTLLRWQKGFFLPCWDSWRAWAAEHRVRRLRAENALVVMRARSLVAALGAWRRHVQLHAAYTAVFETRETTLRTRAFKGWLQWMKRQAVVRQAGYVLSSKVRSTALRGALSTWRAWGHDAGATRLKLHGTLRMLRMQKLGRCFAAWAEYAQGRVSFRATGQEAGRALAAWSASRALRVWRREASTTLPGAPRAVERFVEQVQLRRAARAVARWRANTQAQHAMRRAVQAMRGEKLALQSSRVFAVWLEWASRKRVERATATRAHAALARRRSLAAITRWRQHAALHARLRRLNTTVAVQVGARIKAATLRGTWDTWLHAASERTAMAAYQVMAERRLWSTCFAAWAGWSRQKRNMRVLAEMGAGHLVHFRAWCALARWRARTAEAAHLRATAAAVSSQREARQAGAAFAVWAAWALRNKQIATLVTTFRVVRLEASLHAGLHRWRQQTRAVAVGRAAGRAHGHRLLVNAMGAWKAHYTAVLGQHKARLGAPIVAVNKRRMAAAFDHLRMHALVSRARHIALRTLYARRALKQWAAALSEERAVDDDSVDSREWRYQLRFTE